MTYSEVKILESLIKNELSKRFPVSNHYVSGGKDKPTLMFRFSLDKQSTWLNSDIENSRYFIFTITHKGQVSCFKRSVEDITINDFVEVKPERLLNKLVKVLDTIKSRTTKLVLA